MDLKQVFAMFAIFGRGERQKTTGDLMQGPNFRKMLQNAKFICKGFSNEKGKICGNKCDQEFVEYCKKGSQSKTTKELHYNDFITIGVPQLAELLTGGDREEFCRRLATNGKPKAASGGTKALGSRFYDEDTWTGVARGGPSTTGDGSKTLSGMTDRSTAGVRGVSG